MLQLTALPVTVPSEVKVPCSAPTVLPDRAIGAGEVVTFWAGDRRALRLCEVKRAAAVASAQPLNQASGKRGPQ